MDAFITDEAEPFEPVSGENKRKRRHSDIWMTLPNTTFSGSAERPFAAADDVGVPQRTLMILDWDTNYADFIELEKCPMIEDFQTAIGTPGPGNRMEKVATIKIEALHGEKFKRGPSCRIKISTR